MIIEHEFDDSVYNITILQKGTLTNIYSSSSSVTKSAGRIYAASTILATILVAFVTARLLKMAM